MAKRLLMSCCRITVAVVFVIAIAGCALSQPSFRMNPRSEHSVDPLRLKSHVLELSETYAPRNWLHIDKLNDAAGYIANHFRDAGATVTSQVYTAQGLEYQNVIARFGNGEGPRVIVGAHYDSCSGTPGADDNASGVAGLIELGYLLSRHAPSLNVELVAYTLEEPPFFAGPEMGSAVHARSVAEEKSDIVGVIVLEMIGYFSDEPGSQSYPSLMLKAVYPNKGNFIAVVGRWDQGPWLKKVKVEMKGRTELPVYSIRAPAKIPGIDFSDHRNYWPHDIQAVMITDTAFYRNKAYHADGDTADRLDYERMAQVVLSLFEALQTVQ